MSAPSADVALLTDRRYEASVAAPDDWYLGNILADDRLLTDALAARGLSAARVDWARADVDWTRFACAVFRTTWDYFERFDEFGAWIERAARELRLLNPPELVRWNVDKHYLADLRAKGVPVVPTRFVERDDDRPLATLLAESGWTEAIVKPCVSGAARHTYRVDAGTANAIDDAIRPLRAREDFMLQPFLRDVVRTGEDTLVAIDGRVTHALRKRARPGDFRVQDDHGGTVHPCEPQPDQVALAGAAMAACPLPPLYGRVDMVRDDAGRPVVMELELVEPELWLRRQPSAAEAFADAIARALGRG